VLGEKGHEWIEVSTLSGARVSSPLAGLGRIIHRRPRQAPQRDERSAVRADQDHCSEGREERGPQSRWKPREERENEVAGKLTGAWGRPEGKDHLVWRWVYKDRVQDQQQPALVDDEVRAELRREATYVPAAPWSREALAQVRPPTERDLAEPRVSPSLAEIKVLGTGRTRSPTRTSKGRSTYWNNRPAGPTAASLSVTPPPPHIEHEKIGRPNLRVSDASNRRTDDGDAHRRHLEPHRLPGRHQQQR
jgi:hypothetical protein